MHFIKSSDGSMGEVDLVEQLRKSLFAEKNVLWLVPGGSSIPTTVTVMQQLADTPLAKLTILLGDERYGIVGHKDSNAQQLKASGFDAGQAKFIEVLKNESLADTVKDYNQVVRKAIDANEEIVGQFGIGVDGHIAGVLPGSPAIRAKDLVVAYRGGGFTRITLTIKALKTVSIAYVFAFGPTKKDVLYKLRDKEISLNLQPSQILRQIPVSYVYNDQLGEN